MVCESASFIFRIDSFGCWSRLFILLISRQICVDFISASLLHHIDYGCFFGKKSCILVYCWRSQSFSLFPSVGLALKILVSWFTCLVHFLAFGGGRIKAIRWSQISRRGLLQQLPCLYPGVVTAGEVQGTNWCLDRNQYSFLISH